MKARHLCRAMSSMTWLGQNWGLTLSKSHQCIGQPLELSVSSPAARSSPCQPRQLRTNWSILSAWTSTRSLTGSSKLSEDLPAWRKPKHFKCATRTSQEEWIITSTQFLDWIDWADSRSFDVTVISLHWETFLQIDSQVCMCHHSHRNRPWEQTRSSLSRRGAFFWTCSFGRRPAALT